ncbi:ABC transporter ATP-binding protein [Neptunomonas qingdaonensis]|uniref:Putative ABC transport system ATP-binding protein n=1 Tax=Neptunomonas qingdaonensis TaxID=1045558 RepID=A0A1I2TQ47_9GAMM|nr:ABC transporter ATP-binding protein [Neptunomonas qingdaonensis]SFG65497.1 putative ABC transport system ATP-binding protein [Neptunomonas qingdaonensis]
MAAVTLEQVTFSWKSGTPIIDIAKCEIKSGEHIFIQGPSGSGKSTLLNLLTGLLLPDSGEIRIAGCCISSLSSSERDCFRADHIGFIFQMFNLLPYLSLRDNVMLACRFSNVRKQRAIAQAGSVSQAADQLLLELGLGKQLHQRLTVAELSVGQQQRVAVARALIGSPDVLIADEPTSALDRTTRDTFIQLLLKEVSQRNSTLLLVSHDDTLSPFFDRTLSLQQINCAGVTDAI